MQLILMHVSGSRLDQSPVDSREAFHNQPLVGDFRFQLSFTVHPYLKSWPQLTIVDSHIIIRPIRPDETKWNHQPEFQKLKSLQLSWSIVQSTPTWRARCLGDVRKILDGFLQRSDVHINTPAKTWRYPNHSRTPSLVSDSKIIYYIKPDFLVEL